jgi:hypothetical protein
MKVRVRVVIETEAGEPGEAQDITGTEREELRPDTVGLTLEEAKTILGRLQQTSVEQQTAEYLCTQAHCAHCGTQRYRKGEHTVTLRTLFGKLHLHSTRLYHCQCRPHKPRTFSPLAERLAERSTPELLYVETKWASLMSYGMATKLVQEVLPMGKDVNASTVRNHLHAVAERTEDVPFHLYVRATAFLSVSALRCRACRSSADMSGSRICTTPARPRTLGMDSVTPYFGL